MPVIICLPVVGILWIINIRSTHDLLQTFLWCITGFGFLFGLISTNRFNRTVLSNNCLNYYFTSAHNLRHHIVHLVVLIKPHEGKHRCLWIIPISFVNRLSWHAQSKDPAQHNDSFTSEIHRVAKSVVLRQHMELSNLLEVELFTIRLTGKETVCRNMWQKSRTRAASEKYLKTVNSYK